MKLVSFFSLVKKTSCLSGIYFPLKENEIDSIRDSAISFRQSLAQHLRHTSKEAEETWELIKTNREEIDSLAGSISSEQQRLTNILSSIQREYDNIEATRKKRFENFLEELNDSQQNEFNKLMVKFKEQSDQIENDREVHRLNAEEILHDLGSYSEKAKQILGTLSIDSHAAGYKREADRAWRTKIVFYTITGLLFVLLMISAYWNSLHSTAQFTWQSFASKWTVTIAIGAAVTYFARQAARQEQIERENRNMQLQIATIDPYIEIFEEDERKEIKKQLVDRIFTGVRPESSKDSEKNLGISPIDLPKLIDSVGNVIKINNK
ncbi:WXG100 family type VII secretion target [Paenibacillus tyrfis]|uniref:WXG100 family type VII secretion target n=1 Tax=Paenibacillus tyrfis TaxID=1501230 RepID=UPI00117EAFC4|nr:WXG100 family type VII secretion target [Paenibacillus tyrfis]